MSSPFQQLETNEESDQQKAIKKSLLDLIKSFEKEDKPAHDFYKRRSRKGELYWNNIQDIFWSEVNSDFRLLSEKFDNEGDGEDSDEEEYNTIINIYRAYGESIIAAAGAGLPHVRFFPSDADNPDDILAAKGSSKLSELVAHHNNAEFLFIHALYLLYTNTLLGFYNYIHTDESYGTISQPILETVDAPVDYNVCPNCNFETQDTSVESCPDCPPLTMGLGPDEMSEPMPQQLNPEQRQESKIVQSGTNEIPKAREVVEVYGTANLKVPYYVNNAKDAPYVLLETEQHFSLLRSLFPEYYDEIVSSATDVENYRRPADGYTFDNRGLVTVKRAWLRPWAYNTLPKEESEALKAEYPDGVKVTIVNDKVLSCESEKLDEHWSFYRDPLSSHINTEPLGIGVIPIQDMRSDLVYLTLDTIKHGVGETFVDSDVLNQDVYGKHRNKVGQIIPVNRKRKDMGLDSAFYQAPKAMLSKEVESFFFQLSRDGEFLSRAMPSIFGGVEQGGSSTLGEHESKKNQALQRLSIPWKAVNAVYAECMKKAVAEFAKNMMEDEKLVKRLGSTGYVNVWIRKSELGGKVGQVISETSEQFPLTWPQKKQLLMEMLNLKLDPINSTLFHPENVTTVANVFGFPDLFIPGEDDRNKQLMEIIELLQGQVVQPPALPAQMDEMGQEIPSMMPPPPPQPSIPIEPEVDNSQIHVEVVRAWANSDEGQEAKKMNPGGYANVMAHLSMHLMEVQKAAMMQQGPPQENKSNEEPPQ